MDETIKIERNEGVAILTINRPQASNALNQEARDRFAKLVESFEASDDLRVVVITGEGRRAFCSGGDLNELSKDLDQTTGDALNSGMSETLSSLTRLPVPVIAAINGTAVGGGCEILTACDLRVAVPEARFRFAEVQMALTTGWGGTGRLVKLLGLSRALDLLLTGRVFDAQEALACGFVHRLVPEGRELMDHVLELALKLAQFPRYALAATKELAWMSAQASGEGSSLREAALFKSLWLKDDHLEAMQAFTEKRKPVFNRYKDD